MVVSKDGVQTQRFLAVDVYQMSLVEPETKRLGWGVVKFAGLLQVNCDALVPPLSPHSAHTALKQAGEAMTPLFLWLLRYRTCRCPVWRTTAEP